MVFGFILLSCSRGGKTAGFKSESQPQSARPSAPDRIDIDIVSASPDRARVLMENEHIRVVEYSLKPGERDEWHTHPPKSGYVVSGGRLKVYLENGDSLIADEATGSSFWDDYVGKHRAVNVGNSTITIVLTEIKSLQSSQVSKQKIAQ